MKKILWVKFGWSDYYWGGPIDGNFGWLNKNKGKKDEGKGHEAFNFKPGSDGTYYCYVPPQAKDYAPWNEDAEGWTVICLAKNPDHKGVHIVGWYENATLIGGWLDPPGSHPQKTASDADPGYDRSYCITSKSAYFVPPLYRNAPFSDPSVRQGKFSFLAGPDVRLTENKQRVLGLLEQRLADLRAVAIKNPSEQNLPDPEIDAADPLSGFGTAEHRKAVEKAAERAVIQHYKAKGFSHLDVTKTPCGYDFQFSKGRTQFHVEVKGTASDVQQFFLTLNEHRRGYLANPQWRLAMVTKALSKSPTVKIFDAKQVKKAFDLNPYVYLGKRIAVPETE